MLINFLYAVSKYGDQKPAPATSSDRYKELRSKRTLS